MVLFLLFVTSHTAAQSTLYHVRHFSVEDGLLSRDVTCIGQDTTGLIWIGTSNGLNSFDGEDFLVWSDTSGFISNGRIVNLVSAPGGQFHLLNNYRQGVIFNPYDGELRPIDDNLRIGETMLETISPFPGNEAFFFRGRKKGLYIKSETGITKFEEPIKGARFSDYISTKWNSVLRIPADNSTAQEIDHTGNIRHSIDLSTRPGYHNLILPEGKNTAMVTYVEKIPLRDALRQVSKFSAEGELTLTPFIFPDSLNNPSTQVGKASTGRIALAKAPNGQYWIAFENKLFLFDHNRQFLKDLSPYLEQETQNKWTPNSLFIDAEQRVWLATGSGIFLISPKPNPFTQYFKEINNLPVRGIIKIPNNRLLVGTNRNSRVIDLASKEEVILPFEGALLGITKGPDGNYFGGSHGRSIIEVADDLSYTAAFNFEGLQNINLTVPYYDSLTNTYFIGSSFGLYTADNFQSPSREYHPVNAPDLFEDKQINHFYQNAKGLWISGGGGLYLMDKEQVFSLKFRIKGTEIKHFYEDKSGLFWIATSGSGLYRWDPNSNTSKQYTTNEGLTNNILYAVYEDELGLLWLSSNKGLMQFNPKTEFVRSFHPSDGITHEEFNTYSHFQAEDGRLFFGGLNGVTAFYPKDIVVQQTNIPIRLTGLQQYKEDESALEDKLKDYKKTKRITLTPGDKFFTVRFALQDYSADNTSYTWKVLPQDKQWTYQTENTLRINGLPSGKHQLVIKANSLEIAQNDNQLVLDITVLRPFYQRWPFLTILTLGLSLLIWAYIKYRTWRIEKEKHQLAELVEQRTSELAQKNKELQESNKTKNRLFTLISHDLRAPVISLRGITRKVQFLVAEKRYTEVSALSETVDSAVNSTQNLLDNLLSWAIHQGNDIPYIPESFNINELLASNHELYAIIAANKNIKLVTTYDDTPLLVFADPTGIATILRNLTDNAIKFTPSGKAINISVSAQTSQVTIAVKDEGIGMSAKKAQNLFQLKARHSSYGVRGEKGVGLGLLLSKDIALKNKGVLKLISSTRMGTNFHFSIPFPK